MIDLWQTHGYVWTNKEDYEWAQEHGYPLYDQAIGTATGENSREFTAKREQQIWPTREEAQKAVDRLNSERSTSRIKTASYGYFGDLNRYQRSSERVVVAVTLPHAWVYDTKHGKYEGYELTTTVKEASTCHANV